MDVEKFTFIRIIFNIYFHKDTLVKNKTIITISLKPTLFDNSILS